MGDACVAHALSTSFCAQRSGVAESLPELRFRGFERVRGRERLFAKSRLDIHVEPGIESASLYTSMYRAASTTRKGAPAHGPLPISETVKPGFNAISCSKLRRLSRYSKVAGLDLLKDLNFDPGAKTDTKTEPVNMREERPGHDFSSNLLERITTNPEICHGRPCIRGMRYPVDVILELLSSGMTADEILADYEDLEQDDINAVLAFTARLGQDKKEQKIP